VVKGDTSWHVLNVFSPRHHAMSHFSEPTGGTPMRATRSEKRPSQRFVEGLLMSRREELCQPERQWPSFAANITCPTSRELSRRVNRWGVHRPRWAARRRSKSLSPRIEGLEDRTLLTTTITWNTTAAPTGGDWDTPAEAREHSQTPSLGKADCGNWGSPRRGTSRLPPKGRCWGV
jgi:hypothetical protein